MKRLVLTLAFVIALSSLSFATPELWLVSGSSSATVSATPGVTTVAYSNPNFNQWNILLTFGSSNAPGLLPYGLDLLSLTATCMGNCSNAPLDIYLSDVGFTAEASGFITNFSSTQTGNGSASQTAYADLSNTIFGMSESGMIGTVGAFTGPGGFGGSAAGGPFGGPAPYSLTLNMHLVDNGTGPVSFSTDGNIVAPEPASIALFGSGLFLFAGIARRRFLHR